MADLPAGTTKAPKGADGILFPELGVAVVDVAPGARAGLQAVAMENSAVHVVEAERYVHATALLAPSMGQSYLEGYRDAVNALVNNLIPASNGRAERMVGERVPGERAVLSWDESQLAWGLQAIGVPESAFSGRGVKVAILDTGIDLGHPDFAGRDITSQSFIPGQDVQDVLGHGTHVAGTACGRRQPTVLPRYGVAYNADLFVGKVLSNSGSGTDGQIIAGINWAITNGCRVVSMSLGAPVDVGTPPSTVFENVAQRALAKGTLIIAAAGNESSRSQGKISPVGHPANCPSIMAVAAIDEAFGIADFSCGSRNPNGGEVNIAGPGVNVHSSWPMPTQYRRIMGTSMATPHVSGVAALLAEAKPDISAADLARLLESTAKPLPPLPVSDVGAGLVQAP